MKKISLFMVVTILVSVLSLTAFADELYKFEKWKGVLYTDSKIITVTENSQFDISVTNISIDLFNDLNNIGLSGTINSEKSKNNFQTSGRAYISPSVIHNGKKLLIDLDETRDYKFLSFSIEENARTEMLLKPNRAKEDATMVTLVALDKKTNDILHFEDEIKNDDLFELVKSKSLNLNTNLDSEELEEKLIKLERWYLPYIDFESNDAGKSDSLTDLVSAQKVMYGDVDGNGTINSIDFAKMRQFLLGWTVNGFNRDLADVDGNRMLNNIDFDSISKYLLGYIDEFPASTYSAVIPSI